MKNRSAIVLAAVVTLSTTACATVDRAPVTLLSPTVTVVAGVSMLDPGRAPAVTYDAIQIEPQHAAMITAFAVAAAPDHAKPILVAATSSAPDHAADIDAAAKRVLRRRPAQTLSRIPDHADLVRLVDRAIAAAEQ